VRYFLLGGGPGGRRGDALTAWVQANCTPVPAANYGAASQPASGSDGFGRGGQEQLYVCTGAQGAGA
jgi:hypothetical protein